MRNILKLFILPAVLCLLFPALSSADVKLGEVAPDFTLGDSNGQQRSLSEFAGSTVVLEWFNPQCPFVRKHYDSGNMQGLQKKYTSQKIVWLSIDSSAPGKQGHLLPEEANHFIEEKNLHSTAVLLDPEGAIGKLYGAKTTPHIFIINAKGELIYQGAIDDTPSFDPADITTAKNYVEEILSSILAGETVSPTATKSYGCSVKY